MHTDSATDSLRLVQGYLTSRKQRIRINLAYMGRSFIRSSQRINFRASFIQYLFLCDLFFIVHDIDFASYVDDNSPYTIGNDMED